MNQACLSSSSLSSYRIISYHIISYHITISSYHHIIISSYHIIYHIITTLLIDILSQCMYLPSFSLVPACTDNRRGQLIPVFIANFTEYICYSFNKWRLSYLNAKNRTQEHRQGWKLMLTHSPTCVKSIRQVKVMYHLPKLASVIFILKK